ncbi:transposase [Nitrosomonas sp. Nm58]|uniref:transposase n=1 Tax=Nitrosomonas sp. Nm58 TaxID=200126 RepID=UPI000B82A4FB
MPFYVFCGSQLLVAYLRSAKRDAAKHAGAVLKCLVKTIRARFPHTRIIFRGDSGFRRRHILGWCERNSVGYIIGLTKNARFKILANGLVSAAEEAFKATAEKQRCFGECQYAKHPRASLNCLPLRQHKHVRE